MKGNQGLMLHPYWLFGLFALYGPSLNVVGQLRYVEIVILGLLLFNLKEALRFVGKWERLFVSMFLIAVLAQIASDLINDAEVAGTVKRAGTYVLLALLVIALKWLSRGDPVRIRWMLAGYCVSYVFIAFVPTSWSAGYANQPWQLGLGMAATTFLCLLIAWKPRFAFSGALALLALVPVHLILGGRSLAIVTLVTGMLALAAQFRGSRTLGLFRPARLVGLTLVWLIVVFGLYNGAKIATEAKLFPDELQTKMENQFSNPYGIISAARPDTATALYAITLKPIIGFGSTNFDPDVYRFYVELVASSFIATGGYESVRRNLEDFDWELGTPSHSHLLGAWADAGVFAALSWFAVLSLCIYVFARSAIWQNGYAPLFCSTALFVMWDVIFSPGPHRMDIAIKLMILVYAVQIFRVFDVAARKPSSGGRPPAARFRRFHPIGLANRGRS